MELILLFQNQNEKKVTLLDIESKLLNKKAIFSYSTDAADVWRCLSVDLGTFWHTNGPVCNQMSPILPYL